MSGTPLRIIFPQVQARGQMEIFSSMQPLIMIIPILLLLVKLHGIILLTPTEIG